MKKSLFRKIKLSFLSFSLVLGVGLIIGQKNHINEANATETSYVFSSKSWDDSTSSWTSGKDGSQLVSNQGIQITAACTGANATTKNSFTDVNKVTIKYCTNKKSGVGSINVKIGSGTEQSFSVEAPSSGGTTLKSAVFEFSPAETGKVTITGICTTNSIFIYSAAISVEGGEDTYKVTYNGKGFDSGDLPEDKTEYAKNDEVTVLGNGTMEKTGYTFAGWTSSNTGTTVEYEEDDTFEITENTTLYAIWNPNQMILDYNANGGTGNVPEIEEYDYGSKVDVESGDGLIYTGFNFNGWNTASDGSGTSYSPGEKITMNDDYTLYAQWVEPVVGFELVTDIDDLSVGNNIKICSSNYGVAAGDISSQVLESVSATFSTDKSTVDSANAFVFTLGKVSDNWTLANSDGNLLGATAVKKLAWDSGTTTWSISIDSNGTATISSTNTSYGTIYYNDGSPRFTTYTTANKAVQIYKEPSSRVFSEITSISADVTASNNDSAWNISNISVLGRFNDSLEDEDITSKCSVTIKETLPTITKSEVVDITLVAIYKNDDSTKKEAKSIATLTYISPYSIRGVYNKTNGSSITFDGIYTAQNSNGDMIVCDGAYGLLCYKTSSIAKDFEIGDYVTVTSTLNIYNGLYETKGSSTDTVVELTNNERKALISTPEKYIVTGSEGIGFEYQLLANRLTSITGVVSSLSNESAGVRTNANILINENEITVTLTSSMSTDTVLSKLIASKNGKTEIAINGISTYYRTTSAGPGFEVEFVNFIEISEDYDASDFSSDLLTLTDAVCTEYDGITNNKEALILVWNSLNSEAYYNKLKSNEKVILTEAIADASSEDIIKRAMARYDYLIGKYALGNFISREILESRNVISLFGNSSNSNILIIAVVSLVGLTAIGGYFFYKKRKEN